MRIGEQIQLTADEIAQLQSFIEDVGASNVAFHKASSWGKDANENLFKAINEIHPELAGWYVSLNHDTGIITIHGKDSRSPTELIEFLRAAEEARNKPSV